ncbi:MAG: hypothetical protein R3Y62_02620 [Eubacteriales bacterium]
MSLRPSLVNNILEFYHSKEKDVELEFRSKASIRAESPLGQRDLLGLLSNILENPPHGCNSKGEISIDIFEKNRKLVNLCHNSALTPVTFQDGIHRLKDEKVVASAASYAQWPVSTGLAGTLLLIVKLKISFLLPKRPSDGFLYASGRDDRLVLLILQVLQIGLPPA